MKERSFPNINGSSAKGGAQNGKTSSKDIKPQEGENVKQNFSREVQPYKETEEIVEAVENAVTTTSLPNAETEKKQKSL